MEGTTMEGIIPSLYQGQYVVREYLVLVFILTDVFIDFSNTFDAQKLIMNLG